MLLKQIKKRFKDLCRSKNKNPEKARRECILNMLICLSIFLFSVINFIKLIEIIISPNAKCVSIIYTLTMLAVFIAIYFLSKKGKFKLSAWILIALYTLPTIYSLWFWGADLPIGLIMLILIIFLCGILISSQAAIISGVILNTFLIITTHLQNNNIIKVSNYWYEKKHGVADAIVYFLIIMIITAIVIIFDKQIKIALKKAKEQEKELKRQKDLLEIKVEERTRAIKLIEAEKINQLYRLAEFGRISSGIFHDLINPLTAVSLNLEQINSKANKELGETKNYLNQAISGSRKMQDLINSIKKSIQKDDEKKLFSLLFETKNIVKILNYKARKENVELKIKGDKEIMSYGSPIKFNQILLNLISNAIESYENVNSDNKKVVINIKKRNNKIIIRVLDRGEGIKKENINQIFKPFFTTKKKRGMGLGLSSTRNIIEKYFYGSIEVFSEKRKTTFIVKIPLQLEN